MISDSTHKHNFHTHTYRCKHAAGDVGDYCKVAVELGMETLGFSDHSGLPDNRWPGSRMPYDDVPHYTAAIEQGQRDFPQLTVLKGMECEYIEEFHSYYEDELLGERGFDYLVGASHVVPIDGQWTGAYEADWDGHSLRAYADYTVNMMETRLFNFIAHPDLFGNCYRTWDADAQACSRDMLVAAKELGVGMELNALGFRKQAMQKPDSPFPLYPWMPFWELAADIGAPMIVNSDAHTPGDLQACAGRAHMVRVDLGLQQMDLSTLTRRAA